MTELTSEVRARFSEIGAEVSISPTSRIPPIRYALSVQWEATKNGQPLTNRMSLLIPRTETGLADTASLLLQACQNVMNEG